MALNRTDTRATRDILIHTLIKGRRGHPFRPTTLFQIPTPPSRKFSPSPVWGGSPSLNSARASPRAGGNDRRRDWTLLPALRDHDKCTHDRVCTHAVNNPSRGCNCGLVNKKPTFVFILVLLDGWISSFSFSLILDCNPDCGFEFLKVFLCGNLNEVI